MQNLLEKGVTMTNEELELKVRERQLAKSQMGDLETRVTELNLEISTEMALRGVKVLPVGEWACKQIDMEKASLDETQLLMAGVSVEQIMKGKKVTRYTALRVDRRVGGK